MLDKAIFPFARFHFIFNFDIFTRFITKKEVKIINSEQIEKYHFPSITIHCLSLLSTSAVSPIIFYRTAIAGNSDIFLKITTYFKEIHVFIIIRNWFIRNWY